MRALSLTAALAILLVPAACRSAPLNPGELPEVPPESAFLLPAPFAEGDATAQRETTLRLFSAPVLDLGAIETTALSYEARSRAELARRQRAIVDHVCALRPEPRRAQVERLGVLRERQWARWQSSQARYARSARYRLEKLLAPRSPYERDQLQRYFAEYDTVLALQSERQRLVVRNWEGLLEQLRASEPDLACGDGPAPPAPREALYLPYYIALYRFFTLIPPDRRAEWLVALHSARPSDN